MPLDDYLLLLVAMALATYLPRLLPLLFLTHRQLPQWLREWLELIPAAILGALVAPDLFIAGAPRHLDLLNLKSAVALPTLLFAVYTHSLGGSVLLGMSLYWLAGLVV